MILLLVEIDVWWCDVGYDVVVIDCFFEYYGRSLLVESYGRFDGGKLSFFRRIFLM